MDSIQLLNAHSHWGHITDHRIRFDFVSGGPADHSDGTLEFCNAVADEVVQNPGTYTRTQSVTIYDSKGEVIRREVIR